MPNTVLSEWESGFPCMCGYTRAATMTRSRHPPPDINFNIRNLFPQPNRRPMAALQITTATMRGSPPMTQVVQERLSSLAMIPLATIGEVPTKTVKNSHSSKLFTSAH